MDKLSTLQFCCDELARRESAGAADSWFWGIRRKVAKYCADTERHSGQSEAARPLSADERRHVESTHPFLQPRPTEVPVHIPNPSDQWLDDFRRKLRSFLSSVTRNRENEIHADE